MRSIKMLVVRGVRRGWGKTAEVVGQEEGEEQLRGPSCQELCFHSFLC